MVGAESHPIGSLSGELEKSNQKEVGSRQVTLPVATSGRQREREHDAARFCREAWWLVGQGEDV